MARKLSMPENEQKRPYCTSLMNWLQTFIKKMLKALFLREK